jgi:hypothetical protein
MSTGIFKKHAPQYRDMGYQPRPIMQGTKACKIKGWQRPDEEWSAAELSVMDNKYAHAGIGLLLGSRLPDGTLLGALDIDHNDYIRVASNLLGLRLNQTQKAMIVARAIADRKFLASLS